jgi:TonB-linked SusC/RagA family outer membrane protein
MRRLLLLMLGTLLFTAQLLAQNRTVSGKVTDDKGSGIPNASVTVKGTNIGTTTNSEGNFTLSLPPRASTLVISSVGMASREISITSSNTYSVNMTTSTGQDLTEVVVTGYQTRRKRDEAGAISSIRAAEIENKPNLSLDKALQGRAAGVFVQSNNGIPGGAVNVRIRGIGSILAGNDPLYIVDGVQINTRNDANFSQSNPLAFLNPNDIESIDVLKDAASAAIYGSQASNGVIIITTKKGKLGKPKVQLNAYTGIVTPLKKMETVTSQQLYQLRREAVGRANNLSAEDLAVKRSVLNEFRVAGATTLTDKQADSAGAALPTYNWQDAAFQNSSIQNYELSVGGGVERTTYRVSASYSKQGAVVTNADFNRSGLKFDLGQGLGNKLSMNTSLAISSSNQKLPFSIDASTIGNPAFAAAGIWPINPIYNQDGTYYGIPIYTPSNLAGTLNQNVIATTALNSGKQQTNQMVGNMSFDYKINNWLTFRTLFGIDYRLLAARRITDPRTADGFARKGLTQTQSVSNTNWNTYQTLNFNKEFGKSRTDGLLGYEFRNDQRYSLSASGDGFPTYQFTYLNNAANPVTIGESSTEFKRNAIFGSFNYSYDSRYVVGLVGRYDGSSRFGAGNKFGFFGGVKVAWNIDREAFMSSLPVFSSLRLRASYGTTGNDQIGDFDALGLFGGGGVYNTSAGISYSQLANPDLKWETNTTTNLGLDFGLLRNRITGSVELYNKKTSDLLLNQPLQLSTGFGSVAANVGAMSNRGIELTIGADIIKAKSAEGFNWNTSFIWSYNKNEVLNLYNGLQFLPVTQGVTVPSTFPAQGWVQVGQPFGILYTQQYAGVNPATGRAMWYDTLGNLTYQTAAKDRRFGGSTLVPLYQGGLRNTFTYKRFSLEAFFQYEYGRYETDGQVNFLIENIARINELTAVYDKRWTTPGQLTSFPRMNTSAEAKNSGTQGGDRLWFKADYIRLKNVLLSYDFTPAVLQRLHVANARFYVQGTNLWTISDWYSYDVEFSRTTTGSPVGIIPQSKNYTVGLQLSF